MNYSRSAIYYKVDIAVIGAGQAGLSAAYHLNRQQKKPKINFVVLDDENRLGGAWQHRWGSLGLSNVNGINDLPGFKFADAVETENTELQANTAVPEYYGQYEEHYKLPIIRPVKVKRVTEHSGRFRIQTNGRQFSAKGIINATGTWKSPNCPKYPGWEKFKGLQLHTWDYKNAEEFKEKHMIVVGGGISAIQLLGEISKVTTTTWVTRRKPDFRSYEFAQEKGREAVAMVDERVREGLLPKSVVSVTGLPLTPATKELQGKGVLKRKLMFDEIIETGVRWKDDGTELSADVIFWNTGFHHSLKHLESLNLKNEYKGIKMSGKLATQVEKDHRIHLIGYSPSASTIGANCAGRAAVRKLLATLQLD